MRATAIVTTDVAAAPLRPTRRPVWQFLDELRRSKAGMVGWTIFTVMVLMAVLAPLLTPHDPFLQQLDRRAGAPTISWTGLGPHPLGNDQLGRDLLSRIILGARVTLLVSVTVVILGGMIGTLAGLVSGYVGGWPERIIMRLVDIQLAFPLILLALTVIAVLGPSLPNLIVVLALTSWITYARVIRGDVLSLREREFVQAARALGAGGPRILGRHILPNVAGPATVVATLDLARIVILEASLSFLGLGIQPPEPSWGRMLADGRDFIATAWWIAAFPGIAILLVVLSINLVGDWLRDYFDPELRRMR